MLLVEEFRRDRGSAFDKDRPVSGVKKQKQG
jgi:hypothetical protein